MKMHLSELNNKNKEVLTLKSKLKRAQMVSTAIWRYRDYIDQIKDCIAIEDLTGAEELWDELDYPVQQLLNTAPRYGGVFTTEERAVIRSIWKITEEDISK